MRHALPTKVLFLSVIGSDSMISIPLGSDASDVGRRAAGIDIDSSSSAISVIGGSFR